MALRDDLAALDATGTAALVKRRDITAVELAEAAIERIDRMNGQLNAVIHRQYDRALNQARNVDVSLPFGGVPFLLKDAVAHFAGDPEHFGMRVLRDVDHHATADTWLAQRFRAAGFVTMGRTNVPEMATTITTEPLAYGATHNPWDLSRSTGGSSGGAAAAVAAGMVAVAHANDMGGSIRVPASNCALVGLKPTRARGTLGPDLGELWGPLTHEHVLTRTVRDSAAVLDAIAGPGCGDPYTAPPPLRPFADEVGADPGRLRIGSCTGAGGVASHPEVVVAVEAACRLLEDLGHHVTSDPITPLDSPMVGELVPALFGAIVAREVDRWSGVLGRPIALDELEPMNAFLTEMGRAVTGAQWLAALEGAQAWSRTMAAWFENGHDLLVLPVLPEPPVALGELTVGDDRDALTVMLRVGSLTACVMPFNLTGQPAISLPLHWTADGLPVGVQLVAPYGREDVLLRVASQIEAAQPWAPRRPPVHA